MKNDPEDTTLDPEPSTGPRFVIVNRGDAYLARDSHGYLWTTYLPSALAFLDEEAAKKHATTDAAAHVIGGWRVLDVSTYATRPLLALGGGA